MSDSGILKLKDDLYDKMIDTGERKIIYNGGSYLVIIPSSLFHIFWRKEDKVKRYILNDFTIVIINEEAKKRLEKAEKLDIGLGLIK
jgi:hypothetical protein